MKMEAPEDYIKATNFSKYLKGEYGTKRVFILGYWDDAKNDADFLQTKLGFDYFSRKDLSWMGIPLGGNIDNFLNEKFDILIDLNDYYNVPLRYMLLKSTSKLRIGRYSSENEPYYDIMIGDDSLGFEDYCNEVVKYLSMLQSN